MSAFALPTPGAPAVSPAVRKIAIEEHFTHPDLIMKGPDGKPDIMKEATAGHLGPEYWAVVVNRLVDFHETRIKAMDQAGIEKILLSLTTFGIQAIVERNKAISTARMVNDYLAEQIRRQPNRFYGTASLSFHDPEEAAKELERCVTKLGFKGVMVNGYSQIDSPDNLLYLDDDSLTPFWEAVTALDIPVYLHPRAPFPNPQYAGHPELTGAAWGFAPETATHALRMVYGGLFDRFPTAKLVLGHLGETIPFFSWRIQHGINYSPNGKGTKKRLADYLAENIWVTTSGNFDTAALQNTILKIGADRILFAVDYPYEDFIQGSDFINNTEIAEVDRKKIAFDNTAKLFKL
jgi:predicted TIM-barrel fold metal-dependent hydrolase